MEFINLTPHNVCIFREDDTVMDGKTATLREGAVPVMTLASQGVARATTSEKLVGDLEGVSVFRMEYGNPVDLPEPKEGTYLVVSAITANAAKASGRTTADLLLTAHLVRDAQGRPVGCTGFAVL